MSIRVVQVDAFTHRPFAGNPAAVCVLPANPPDAWMRDFAAEMNLSETAFLVKQSDGYNLRWFTPSIEVDLCGHATLASAHVLWEDGLLLLKDQARFHTRSGLLLADARGDWIELDFPAKVAVPAEAPPILLEALGLQALKTRPRFIGKSQYDYLVELESEDVIRELRPDFATLKKLPVRGVIVTAPGSASGFDFVSRFFAPGAGIDEDPVTGSSHCALGPYWSGRLGKSEFVAQQASARGGVIRVRNSGDRVILGGQAITVFHATLADSAIPEWETTKIPAPDQAAAAGQGSLKSS